MAENTPLNANPEKNDMNDAVAPVPLIKKLTAELIGTFLLTFAILASVQNMILLETNDFWLVCVTHGLVLGLVAFIYGPISGGHVNPAVSFAFLLKKKMSIVEFVTYVIAQCLGSFLAAMVVSGLFHVNFTDNFPKPKDLRIEVVWDGGLSYDHISCSGLCNAPVNEDLHLAAAFFTEVIGTFILILAVLATADSNNKSLESPIAKVTLLAFAIILAGTTVGKLTGFAINPARDFAPRVWASMFYGLNAFNLGFAWVPVVGPMVGSALAVGVKALH